MELRIDIKKTLPHFDLDVAFACPDERMLVLIGPSGGGKTTIIRIIAGLERADGGTVVYDGATWLDVQKGIFVPPQKRRLGYVFQEYTLFPHLNVYGNIAFSAHDKKDVDELLRIFGIRHLRNRKPYEISGGERQRCAICQALARRPQVLLLDEPFSALDVITRRMLRDELRALKGTLSLPIVYVTHDVNEALFLADDILPVVEGKIDRKWMQQTITRVASPETGRSRAVREPRLSLAY
ncbi:MAG: ATP-binding cassette domain-containing protein [Deltaproteobacteria bacterium]|nr:ATP-binding cassette domain-containing protein [Deltaproteobacteria bacterium]